MKHTNLTILGIIVILFCGCTKELDSNDNVSINYQTQYSNPEHTSIVSEYPLYARYFAINPDEVITLTDIISNQKVDLSIKSELDEQISAKFSPQATPLDLQGISTHLSVITPSVVSLYSDYENKFEYKKEKDKISFDGYIDTGNFYAEVSGELQSSESKENLMEEENNLKIELKNQRIKNTYGWDNGLYVTRVCLQRFDPWLSGGFYCKVGDTKLPGLENYDITNEEFLNLVLNTDAFAADAYQGGYALSSCCINDLFTRGAFAFYKSGVLVSGENVSISTESENNIGITNPLYLPDAIRYEPVSTSDVKLYLNPVLLAEIYTKCEVVNGVEMMLKDKVSPSGYQKMFAELYESLSTDIMSGLNLHKRYKETLSNGDLIYTLEFDKEVGRKIMLQFISMLKDPQVYEMFMLRFNGERGGVYNISKEDLQRAMDALPAIIESSEDLQFGVEANLPKDYTSPYN